MTLYRAVAVISLLLPGLAWAQQPPQTVSIASGDAYISARLLPGDGEGARPAVVLFNGFPSGSNIPKAAFQLQTAGFTVLLPQYRGTGDSGGTLSLANSREDGISAVDWLKGPGSTGVDARRIAVFGVSYGGWVALQTAAVDSRVSCVIALVPADFGMFASRWKAEPDYRALWKTDLDEIATDPRVARFGPAGVDGFMAEAIEGGVAFSLAARAGDIANRPVFVAGGRQDPAAPFAQHYVPLVEALRTAGAPFSALEFQGGHNPSEATAAAISFVERACFAESP